MLDFHGNCPATAMSMRHDWRYASHAPGWRVMDDCVRCERCGIRAIVNNDHWAACHAARAKGGQ